METLDLAIRNLLQEFQEGVTHRFALEENLRGEGTFTRKKVKGKDYWYQQRYSKGQAVQAYIGPATPENEEKIVNFRKNQKNRKNQIRELTLLESKRMALLKRASLPVLDPLTSLLIEKLSHWRLIYEKGVLIGSCAFAAYAGMLGRLFEKTSLKTLDIDVVRDCQKQSKGDSPKDLKTLEIVSPNGFIEIRGKNFSPVPGLSHKSLPSSFIGPGGLRIDFLTPLRGRPRNIVPLPNVPSVGAQALHFLDFLIKNPVHTVLLGNRTAIPVTVPDPCRYAIHKLIVANKRPRSENSKRVKDILQASQLIVACSEEHPGVLKKYFQEAMQRGKGWKQALTSSLQLLSPEVKKLLES